MHQENIVIDKEKRKAYLKKYRENNKEKIKSSSKKYYENNKEKENSPERKIQKAEYRRKNKDKISLRRKIYRDDPDNKKKKSIADKEYRSIHRDEITEKRKPYFEARKDINVLQGKEYRKVHRKKYRFNQYKNNAKYRGLIFELTKEQFEELIDGNCFYCGDKGGGVDRVDNNIGYIVSNCVSACVICNRAKNKYSFEEYIDKCKKVAKKHG
jgi:hypothetical protein